MNDSSPSRLRRLLLLPALLIALAAGLSACDSVELEPKGETTASDIFRQDGSYLSYLAKLYAGLNVTGQEGPFGNPDIEGIDEGFSQYIRLWWQMQELPTDAAVIAFNDGTVQELNTNTWSADNGFSSAMYSRVYFQVAHANEFLRQSSPDLLQERGVSEEVRAAMPQWRAEARFLRALSYWHGLDLFGPIPIVEEDFPIGSGAPEQNTREEVFNFVESELLAIIDDSNDEVLPDPGQEQYGRASKGAAWMVLAKLYQNAIVYTGNDRSGDVVEFTERIIDSNAYQLEETYQHLFLADNDTSDELIFAIPHDGNNTRHFGGTNFLTCAAYGGAINPEVFGMDCAFGGLRTTSAYVDLFIENDERGIFFTEGQSLEIENLTTFTDGYAVTKYRNVTSNGEAGVNGTHPDTDYPMFRLGDAYLMYAEAVLRGGGGSETRARNLVNELRSRAGLGSDVGPADFTLPFILDERGRELMWEASRRMDLIRFGQYTGNDYLWPWKGGEPNGQIIPEHLALYPLPSSELAANPNLEQNSPEY